MNPAMQMIDWNRLNALNHDFGADALGEVVALFIEEMDEAVLQLPAIDGVSARADALHMLKGTAANLGLVALAELCALGEDGLRGNADAPDFPVLAGRVRTTYAASRSELLRQTPDRLGVQLHPPVANTG